MQIFINAADVGSIPTLGIIISSLWQQDSAVLSSATLLSLYCLGNWPECGEKSVLAIGYLYSFPDLA